MLVGMSGEAVSQEHPSLRDRAEELFRRYEYAAAVPLYIKLADAKRPQLKDLEHLAECYRLMNDYESAENWYARVVQHEDSDVEQLLRYGTVLKSNGKYAEAKKQLEQYAEQTGDRERVALEIAGCDSAMVWMADPTIHRLRNEAAVNTEYAEFGAFPLGEKVAYTGEPDPLMTGVGQDGRTGNSFLRVYTADRSASNALADGVIAEGAINSGNYHVGPVASPDGGQTLYVTRTYPGKEGQETKEDQQKFRTNPLELLVYTRQGDAWQVEPFAYNNVETYSVGHAAFSSSGDTLYFASDMPGGQGGVDIWYSTRQEDGSWAEPTNAGEVINSSGDELFPNIGPDGTLYYSSDGFAGMGGLDVFRAEGGGSSWNTPQNMRFPVNSAADDFAYIINFESPEGIAGYLSSNRRGGVGNDDIYSFTFEKPKIIIVLEGTVADRLSGGVMEDAAITLYDGDREIVAHRNSDSQGEFTFMLSRDQQYTVLGQKEGYHADSAKVTTEGIVQSDTLRVALLLDRVLEKGLTFELENFYYDFDKYNIRPDAAVILDELVRILRDNPTLKIELSSHTDSRGSDEYNMLLSQRRAESAVDYLVSRGIARDRMVAKGYGETRLVNRCANGVGCSVEEHQANRRTEVTVLDY